MIYQKPFINEWSHFLIDSILGNIWVHTDFEWEKVRLSTACSEFLCQIIWRFALVFSAWNHLWFYRNDTLLLTLVLYAIGQLLCLALWKDLMILTAERAACKLCYNEVKTPGKKSCLPEPEPVFYYLHVFCLFFI